MHETPKSGGPQPCEQATSCEDKEQFLVGKYKEISLLIKQQQVERKWRNPTSQTENPQLSA